MKSRIEMSLYRSTVIAIAAAFSTAALCQSVTGSSVPTTPRTLDDLRALEAIEAARQAAIDTETAANGPLSPQLAQLYFSLATHYRERDDDLLAAEALEQALHIERVTHGLFSMEQVAVSRELIEASLAIGDSERAAELDIMMMRVARLNLDDVRSARILSDTADRQFTVYRRYLAGELPPQININLGSTSPLQRIDPNRFMGVVNLQMARRNWADAIDVIVDAGGESDPRIVELENRLISSYHLERLGGEPTGRVLIGNDRESRRVESLFRRGVRSYRRLLAFATRNNDIEVAANGMIGLADWHLLFHKNASALRLYADAWEALEEMGASQQFLDEIFNPAIPVILPAFNPNPLKLAAAAPIPTPEASRFVDISMVMSRYGRSRLRNLDLTPDPEQREVRSAIRRIVAHSRFRPILVDGEPQHTAELEFRYYIDDPGMDASGAMRF